MTDLRNNQRGFGVVGVILLIVAVLVVGYVGLSVLHNSKAEVSSTDLSGAFSTYDVKSKDANFTVEFYDSSELVKNGSNQQIVSTGTDGKKIGVWVKEIHQPAPCGNDPTFTYTSKYELVEACYRSDRLIYASTVTKDSKKYFVSITAQKAVSQDDAVRIFSSVEIK